MNYKVLGLALIVFLSPLMAKKESAPKDDQPKKLGEFGK